MKYFRLDGPLSSGIHNVRVSLNSIFSEFTGPSSPSLYFVNYLAMITVTPQVKGAKTECNLTAVTNDTWEFSNYDLNGVYENNAHCIGAVSPGDDYHLVMWFEIYHIEEPFDYVLAQSALDRAMVQLSGTDVYSTTNAMILLEFQSDGNIAYSGFVLKIQQYGDFVPIDSDNYD